MKKPTLSESNFELWLLIGKVNHAILRLRQKELSQRHVLVRQYQILRTIQNLGSKATLSAVAKVVDRQEHVISRQACNMDRAGLIKRIQNTPGSTLFKLELTKKGLSMIKVAKKSEAIDAILLFLTNGERQQMESVLNRILIKISEYTPK